MDTLTDIFEEDELVTIYPAESFEGMRIAGNLAAAALDEITPFITAGCSTEAIDRMVYDFALAHAALPATLNYRGYRHNSCISINHVICHGIPSARVFREGDIVNVDITLIKDGWHGDTSRMFFVGEVSVKARRLAQTAFESLWAGIEAAKPGNTTGDIGAAIEAKAQENNMSVVREFTGHGLGKVFHTAPTIFNFGTKGAGTKLEVGMFFTIEPMVNLGKAAAKILPDGWTAVTRDRSLSAQFEHSIGITATGCEVFTLSPAGLHSPFPTKTHG